MLVLFVCEYFSSCRWESHSCEPVNDFLLREVLRVRHMGLLAGLSIMLCGYDRKGLCKIKIRNSNQATGGMFANSVILSL
jgi:hypothetical protein